MAADVPSAGGGMFRRILVGYDGSAEAQRALQVGTVLAGNLGGEAHVLQVVRPGAHAETGEERERALAAEYANLSRGLGTLQTQSGQRWAVTTAAVYADDPAAAMAAYAEEHGFDLLVVGVHGREQSTHRGLGHSLEGLLRHHPCPVLVV